MFLSALKFQNFQNTKGLDLDILMLERVLMPREIGTNTHIFIGWHCFPGVGLGNSFTDLPANQGEAPSCPVAFVGVGLVAKSCQTLCDPMDIAQQAPLSMRFSRQEYCSALPFFYVPNYK